jgi:hypothetical protein
MVKLASPDNALQRASSDQAVASQNPFEDARRTLHTVHSGLVESQPENSGNGFGNIPLNSEKIVNLSVVLS